MQKTDANTVLAIFYVAFAVTVLLTAGLVVVLPTTIQQAQATVSEANEHISEQGRAHQSERGAERSGVREPVFCLERLDSSFSTNTQINCFETLGDCEFGEEHFEDLLTSGCEEFDRPPSGSRLCSPSQGGIACGERIP